MKSQFLSMLGAAIIAVILAVGVPACGHVSRTASPDSKAKPPAKKEVQRVVNGQQTKDETVVGEADSIDTATEGTPAAEAVAPHTAAIRKAVADNPASDVAKLAADFAAATSILTAANDGLVKENAKLKEENATLKNAEAKAEVSKMRGWGFSAVGIGAVLTYLSIAYAPPLRVFGLGLLGVGFVLLAFAQLWAYVTAQWWFMPATGLLCASIVYLVGRAIFDGIKHKTLAADANKAATQATEALKVIVATTEKAKKDLGKSAPISALLDLLDRKMSDPHKAVVEDIVRETKPV